MKVLCFVMAESASVSPDGRLSIQRTFDRIALARRPGVSPNVVGVAKCPSCVLVAYLEWSAAKDGLSLAMVFRVLGADGVPVRSDVAGPPLEAIPNTTGRPMRRPFIIGFRGLSLPGAGDYTVQLLVNGALVTDLEIYVDEVAG